MAGHSKWNNIKHTKAAEDARKGKVFSKIARDIRSAVKLGGSNDPKINGILKSVLERARQMNMTSDRIKSALDPKENAGNQKSNNYEVLFTSGAGIIIECTTTNPTELQINIKTILHKNSGKLVNEGEVSWNFSELAMIDVSLNNNEDIESIVEFLLEKTSFLDYSVEDKLVKFILNREGLRNFLDVFISSEETKNLKFEISFDKVPKNYIEITNEEFETIDSTIEKLKEIDDIDEIWPNFKLKN